jgi:hypothetical protein
MDRKVIENKNELKILNEQLKDIMKGIEFEKENLRNNEAII